MDPAPAFQPFGPSHLAIIAGTLLLPLAFAFIVRRTRSPLLDRLFSYSIAALQIANYIGYLIFRWHHGALDWREMLPFQLCDWTMFAVIVALLSGGWRAWLEVAYFWGIGGSLQAILTPNLRFGFPDFRFLSFFAEHCGIVIGILYLMITRRFRPTLSSIWRTLAWSEFYLVITLVVDRITGFNYGFLLHKPEAFSILNYLSDSRPLYILQMNLLALAFFALLYAPFFLVDLICPRPPRSV
jgi:hypothetical integral membrane protein (TIGR02206 family)